MADIYDSHEAISGVSGATAQLIPRNFAANQVNRLNRYDRNRTRLPIRHIELEFESEKQKHLFEGGNFQGATFYNSYPSFLRPYLICSVAGTIFKIEVVAKKGYVTQLFTGNDPVLRHTWFAQGFDWLVIQNGYNPAIVWNGVSPARRSDPTKSEVPIGSVMAFIHGRLVVADANGTNQIAAGDIVYGGDQTTTGDIIKFTETEYWAEGGAFGAPVFVGDITGMYAMPYLDTGTGQNELVVLGTEGAISIDLSRPRSEWNSSQLLRISLIGGGCVSTHSLCALNGDLFFRSSEGIRSYRNARAEFSQSWRQAPISSDVRKWLDYDSPRLLEFNSQVTWNNLLLSTCSPMQAKANNIYAGEHRFHRGFVVMDAQSESNALRTGAPVWYGAWTGIRVTQFVEGRIDNDHRCFAFSYDRDGVNRLYEIEKDGSDDVFEGTRKRIFSYYDSYQYGAKEGATSKEKTKLLKGGELEYSHAEDRADIEILLRPENSPCFYKVGELTAGCECVQSSCFQTVQATGGRHIFGGMDRLCDEMTGRDINKLRYWQMRVVMQGAVTVERLAIRFTNDPPNDTSSTCSTNCRPITCCPNEDDYTYHIAPEGENTNIPEIAAPSDVSAPVYQSVKTYRAWCPDRSNSSTRTATASSTISQSDADLKAYTQAKQAAETSLICLSCTPQTPLTFEVQNTSYDLAGFFAPSVFSDTPGVAWRLIDGQTMEVYGDGMVTDSGTLNVTWAQTDGDTTFNPETNIFTDSSGSFVPVYLQLACPDPSGPVWPELPELYSY